MSTERVKKSCKQYMGRKKLSLVNFRTNNMIICMKRIHNSQNGFLCNKLTALNHTCNRKIF